MTIIRKFYSNGFTYSFSIVVQLTLLNIFDYISTYTSIGPLGSLGFEIGNCFETQFNPMEKSLEKCEETYYIHLT